MTCQEILDFLMLYLDGELPADEAARFKEHLAVCPACVDYLETYQATIRLGRAACKGDSPCKDVPEDLVRAILASRRSSG